MVVSKSEFIEWKNHPVTIAFKEDLIRLLEDTKDAWVEGSFTAPNADETLQLSLRQMAAAQTLKTILEAVQDGVFVDFADSQGV